MTLWVASLPPAVSGFASSASLSRNKVPGARDLMLYPSIRRPVFSGVSGTTGMAEVDDCFGTDGK